MHGGALLSKELLNSLRNYQPRKGRGAVKVRNAESGLVPETIIVDEQRKVSFDLHDAKLVRDGKMKADEYEKRHTQTGG